MNGIRFLQTIQVKLIIIYVLLILIAMQLIGIYFVKTLETTFLTNFSSSLSKQAYLLTEYVKPYLSANPEDFREGQIIGDESLNDVVMNLSTISGAEIQIIDSNGIVISTSRRIDRHIVNTKTTQTEVNRALQGIKFNEWEMMESGERKKAIALPVSDGGKVLGAVYLVSSMEDMYATVNRINRIFVTGTLFALALTAMLGIILSNTITRPIKEITRRATAMAEGDFNQRVNVVGSDEIGQLGRAFNYMTNRLKEALSSNEEEKEKLASILSNMSDGVIATDDMGRVIVVNQRARQILRLDEKQPLGVDIADLLGMTKEQIGHYVLGEEHAAVIHITPSDEDEPLTIHVLFSAIHRRDRGVTGTIAVLHDVTEQVKLEQSRREFVANVSHELRTPLTTIKSYLEALDDGAVEDSSLAKRFIGVTRNEAERMIRLVTDLLHLSRLDSRQTAISKEPTDILLMLEDVADRFSFQLKQRSIGIKIDAEQTMGKVLIDQDQIDQVLDNLVSNAIKYTPDEGNIAIRARRKDKSWIEVVVEDNGIGIPKKDQNRIFERFYRVDKARSRNMGGTGLGLSIAREIIKAHGGTITLESELQRGTKVTFTLPVAGKGDLG
jgi:two-component system sensor histidine kinase VicK